MIILLWLAAETALPHATASSAAPLGQPSAPVQAPLIDPETPAIPMAAKRITWKMPDAFQRHRRAVSSQTYCLLIDFTDYE